MANIIPFESTLPAFLQGDAAAAAAAAEIMSGGLGFPVMSIKGKTWTIVRSDERKLLTKPDEDGEEQPVRSIEVVILRGNVRDSKTYYATGYVEGSTEKPTCYSNDGVAPAADAAEPQSAKCATCAHNQWGSRVSEDGQTKGKACSDVRRLAIAAPGMLNDPMLLRVPPASLKAMSQYGDQLKKRNLAPFQVITKLGFAAEVSNPQLTFRPIGFVTEAMYKDILEARESDVVMNIVGQSSTPAPAAPPAPAVPDKPAPAKPKAAEPAPAKAAETPKKAPAKKAAVVVDDDGDDALTKALAAQLAADDDD